MSYSRDPRWITAGFESDCHGCGDKIRTADRIYYYPIGRRAFGSRCGCAPKRERDFRSMVASESYQAY